MRSASCGIAVLIACAVATAAPAADRDPAFTFAEQTPLVVSCSALSDGVEVVLRNETTTPQVLNIQIGRITDSDGTPRDAKNICGGLTVKTSEPAQASGESPAPVGPGADGVVTLHANATPTNGKTYTSTLTAYGNSGGVARRALTITQTTAGPTAKVAGGAKAAVPLIASRDIAHHQADPFDDWVVWLPVNLPESEAPALVPGQAVGAVSGERGTAAVTYGPEPRKRLSATTSLVPLHIQKVGAGKYSGKVDLTPDDAAATGEVSLSLTSSHWWPLALLPLLAGIGIALLVQSFNGYWVTRGRLVKRVTDTSPLRDEARARLQDAAQGADWGNFNISDLEALQDALEAEIRRRTARKWIVIDQKIVDDLGAKIDTLSSQIGVLDTIAKAAPLLVSALVKLAAERPGELPPLFGSDAARIQPRLAESAEELLVGSPMSAADLVDRATEITAMVTTVRALHRDEQALSHYWRLAQELERDLDNASQTEVPALKSLLMGIRHALWDADSAKVVDDAVEDFDKVRDKIDELWPKLPTVRPLPLPRIRLWRAASPLLAADLLDEPAGLRARLLESATIGGALEWDHAILLDPLLEVGGERAVIRPVPTEPPAPQPPVRMTPTPPLTEADASKLITRARWTQWLVLVASIVFAVITGLSALYVGKPWGTFWDYVFAASWGLTSQAVIATIAGAITGLGALAAVRHGLGRPKEPAAR